MFSETILRTHSPVNFEVTICLLRRPRSRGEADDEHWRIMVDDLEVAEGGEIGGLPVCRQSAYEANRTWNDAGDEKSVV